MFLFLIPAETHAGVFSAITDKIMSVVSGKDSTEDENTASTAQTMEVLKPEVVSGDASNTTEDGSVTGGDTLSATAGTLRFSTEDLDIPLNDTISVYEVKKGDTIASVAKAYGVSKNTIIWANDIKGSTLTPGDTLVILPITGIKYTIRRGDTVSSIAKKYKADVEDIAKYNGIAKDAELASGDVLLVPEGEIAQAPAPVVTKKKPTPIASRLSTTPLGFFVRPLQGGLRTQGIHGHNAVDIAAARGTPVVAAASGKVIIARTGGYNGGYGNMIVIVHENNIQTLYAHLKEIYITPGSTVTQGQVIGAVGNTGRSTGPHLHVEVRGAVNPF
jgi:murein DD-endopeptidase MepM/ murein hydrolase activator NlpD